MSRSASSQWTCPFYSSHAGFWGKASHHPGLSAPLQPRFGSLRLLAFPKPKIAVEMEVICECDSHTVHKRCQRRLTADWLAPQESSCLQMHSKVSSEWLPSYIKATWPVLEILKMDVYFQDNPLIGWGVLFWALIFIKNGGVCKLAWCSEDISTLIAFITEFLDVCMRQTQRFIESLWGTNIIFRHQ